MHSDRYRRRLLPAGVVALLTAVLLVSPFGHAASAGTNSAPWPSAPNWSSYVEAPSGSSVCPVAVVSTGGSVSGAQNLLCGGSGTATITGQGADILLDYGKDVGGIPTFTVTAEAGSPRLKAGYSESLRYAGPNGDTGSPWGEGDSSRADTYTVTGPGTISNHLPQGGERYQQISLTTAGSVTLSKVSISYIADRANYAGWFDSSSDTLNKIWYDGAYTAQLDAVPTGSLPGAWSLADGVLTAAGGDVGLLTSGSSWSGYTLKFDAEITNQQAGWIVHGQDPNNAMVFILNDSTDTAGTPNTLQELVLQNGTYTSIGTAALPSALAANTWHTVTTAVNGSTYTISLDGTPIASVTNSTFTTGTIGFREFGTESAAFRNVSVSNGATTLYNGPRLADFAVPGVNSLPSILDGAKRDRAIWVGDMNVEGPTVFYSTNETQYIKSSLQLLGSYQQSNGAVAGALAPATTLHTGPDQTGTAGFYSASYSMYWVLGLAAYYRFTGDTAFVQQEWPIVRAELAWNAALMDSRGLLVTDSGNGADWDFYDPNKTGAVTEYNLLYYKALVDGATLAAAAGQSNTYATQAATLKNAINANLFNSSTGLYKLSDTNGAVAQDANALAVLYGVAANPATVLAGLKTKLWTSPYGPLPFSSDAGYRPVISTFISGYELQARLSAGDSANAERLMLDEWGHMAGTGSDQVGTTWENILAADGTPGLGSDTSLAHGWGTGATSALSGYVLGIQPATAGYATWLVQPHPGDLAWAEGQAPTPHGAIGVQYAGRAGVQQFSMQVTAPPGTTGTIAIPTYGTTNPIVTVNGSTAYRDGAFTAVNGVTGAHVDADYVYLTGVQPGTYLVAANPSAVGVPAGFTSCAVENGTCSFTGTKEVAYGANGLFTYQTLSGGTACTGDVFGDPDYGVAKACYTGPVTSGPTGSTFCAQENGLCTFAGTRTVAYGAGSAFVTKSLTAGTPCTNTVFTDPSPNLVKSCFLE
jgi:alpha-L-rhamnosidase